MLGGLRTGWADARVRANGVIRKGFAQWVPVGFLEPSRLRSLRAKRQTAGAVPQSIRFTSWLCPGLSPLGHEQGMATGCRMGISPLSVRV